MARMNATQSMIQDLVSEFAAKITDAVRTQIIESLNNGQPALIHSNGAGRRTAKNGNGASAAPKPRKPLSREAQKARKLQGQYMGGLRRLNKQQTAQVKKVRAEKGMDTALALIAKMSKVNEKASA